MRCFLCVNHYTVHQPICSHPLFSSFPAWSHLESLSSCPTSAHCASFLSHTHTHTKSHGAEDENLIFHRCLSCVDAAVLHRNASISMFLEFVDSLVKWNGSDGASNVLFGLLESNKSTEYLVFFTSTDTMDVYVPARTLLYIKPDQNITLWNYPLKLIIYLHSVLTLNSWMGFRQWETMRKKLKREREIFIVHVKSPTRFLIRCIRLPQVFQDFICQHLLCPAAFTKNNTSGQSADPLHWPLTPADRSYLDWMVLTNFHIRPQHTETKAGHQSRVLLHLKVTAKGFKVLLLFYLSCLLQKSKICFLNLIFIHLL